jgi:hypothetical protein
MVIQFMVLSSLFFSFFPDCFKNNYCQLGPYGYSSANDSTSSIKLMV